MFYLPVFSVLFRLLALVALALFVAGCDPAEPETTYTTHPGEIVVVGYQSFVEIGGVVVNGPGLVVRGETVSDEPPVVRAGIPFDVTVGTFGTPCTQPVPSVITQERQVATIEVMDADPEFCVFVLRPHLRTDQVVFEEPGPAEVVVVGEKVNPDGSASFVRAELRFPVVVTE